MTCPVIVIVLDNGMYGTIRMHQEREFPGRVVATELKNPDFAALAPGFWRSGERVERTEEFAPAFERALASGKSGHPALHRRSAGAHAGRDPGHHPGAGNGGKKETQA